MQYIPLQLAKKELSLYHQKSTEQIHKAINVVTMKVDGTRLILDATVKEPKSLGWSHGDAQSRNKWKIKRTNG